MLKVETTPLLEVSETTSHNVQFPTIASNHSDVNGTLLSIMIGVNLKENELYSVNIITVNDKGEANSTGNIQFSKYSIGKINGED